MGKNVINSNTFTCIGYFPSLVMKLSKSPKVISWGKTERSPGSICGPSRKLIGLMAVYHELELMYTIIYCSTNAILQFCF
jgi:hypothetical protein